MTASGLSSEDNTAAHLIGLDEVFRQYAGKCYGFALRIVRDHDLAQDVVQDVFEALARQPGRYEADRGTWISWLLTLTHHKAVDLVRWRERHTRLDVTDDALVERPALDGLPEDVVWSGEHRAYVLAALLQLEHAHREVLVLAHYGGYSQQEIARRTGLPLGTVKGRTRGALRSMRAIMGPN